ncbi:UvrD-helicase domain-containing protein [uncultured Desulfovibrio sp.]|uniref:UvrD-helicase domain-containing protein n=1 Tax=uncultured Desulfovibrio sp. TaxID=167968 RepID=UPI0003A492CE|nr:UvrD-helicase domain-containing protein [uncultured Desulfovibrio sp.]
MDFKPTAQQQAVINHEEGPLLVIAGPGAGKTFTLVERIVHLVACGEVSPEQLLVATFTEKAANELISRIARRLLAEGNTTNVDEMYVGTLHSICLRLLEEHREFTRLKKNFTLMDQFDQSYFFFQRLRQFEELAPISLHCRTGKYLPLETGDAALRLDEQTFGRSDPERCPHGRRRRSRSGAGQVVLFKHGVAGTGKSAGFLRYPA